MEIKNPSHVLSGLTPEMLPRGMASVVLATIVFATLNFSLPADVRAETNAPIRIVAFGDSLVAGYGLRQQDALPEQLIAALKATYPDLKIINAGVSGDTTGAALARLDWAFPPKADGAIVLLGGNDFLRGLSPQRMKRNLDEILTKLKQRNLEILILGMKAARNTGKAYWQPFDAAFPALAKKHDTLLDPFYLEGVAATREFNQIDGIHPNAKGVAKIVKRILPQVENLIARIRKARKNGTTN